MLEFHGYSVALLKFGRVAMKFSGEPSLAFGPCRSWFDFAKVSCRCKTSCTVGCYGKRTIILRITRASIPLPSFSALVFFSGVWAIISWGQRHTRYGGLSFLARCTTSLLESLRLASCLFQYSSSRLKLNCHSSSIDLSEGCCIPRLHHCAQEIHSAF